MQDPRNMLRHVDLKRLRQLIEVAEQGSIRAAADSLAITQPALSRSIKTLESTLKSQLVVRGPKGTELTIAGETLLKYARIIEANLALAGKELQGLNEHERPIERVACGMSW